MNKIVTLIKTMIALFAATVSVYAYSAKDTAEYMQALNASLPVVPLKVVAPSIGPDYEGQTINVVFTVKSDGKIADLKVKSFVDVYTESKIAEALKQWAFKPRTKEGATVDTIVSLPIKVVAAN